MAANATHKSWQPRETWASSAHSQPILWGWQPITITSCHMIVSACVGVSYCGHPWLFSSPDGWESDNVSAMNGDPSPTRWFYSQGGHNWKARMSTMCMMTTFQSTARQKPPQHSKLMMTWGLLLLHKSYLDQTIKQNKDPASPVHSIVPLYKCCWWCYCLMGNFLHLPCEAQWDVTFSTKHLTQHCMSLKMLSWCVSCNKPFHCSVCINELFLEVFSFPHKSRVSQWYMSTWLLAFVCKMGLWCLD